MGRPPLPVGTWGAIRTEPLSDGRFRARAKFRDFDGVTRQVERVGRTRGAARGALSSSLAERTGSSGDDITGATRLSELAEVWFTEASPGFAAGSRTRYRATLDNHILRGVGGLLIREATVSRLDTFIKTTTTQTGAATAKLCRSVLSGMLGLAVRHGALATNPIRDVAGITVTAPEPRPLTLDEIAVIRRAALAWQEGRPLAEGLPGKRRGGAPRTTDLLDIVDLLLGTGARIGEVLALRWEDIDLDKRVATISGTIVRDETGTLVRQPFPKSASSRRQLSLPRFAVDTLMRRRVGMTVANVRDLVYPSAAGTLRDPSNVRAPWRKVMAAIGFEWVTPHTMRKTVATLLNAERDLETAASQMGHSNKAVTARHYVQRTHMGPDVRMILDALAPADELS